MQSLWSKPVRIEWSQVDRVPHEYGVYEIGFLRLGWFQQKFIGRANSSSDSLRTEFQRYAGDEDTAKRHKRLAGSTCTEVFEYRDTHQLYYRFIVTDHASCMEARMLTKYSCGLQTRYGWNRRSERAVCRIHPEGCPKRSKRKDSELIFCVEHGCACLEQPHDADYMDQDGWCLLLPQLANLVPQDTGMYQLGYLDDAGCFVPRYVNSVVRDVGTLRAKFRKYTDGRGAFFDKVSPFERHRALCFAWQRVVETDAMAVACRLAAYCVQHCSNNTARDLLVNYTDWRKWCEAHLKSCQRCAAPAQQPPEEAVDDVEDDAEIEPNPESNATSNGNAQRRSLVASTLDEAEEPYTSRSTYVRTQTRRQTSTVSRSSRFG